MDPLLLEVYNANDEEEEEEEEGTVNEREGTSRRLPPLLLNTK